MPAHEFDLIKVNHARAGAVLADLRVGLTLAKLALEALPGSDKRRRNTINARKAYDSVVSFMDTISFTRAEERQLNDGLAGLKYALEQLGESF